MNRRRFFEYVGFGGFAFGAGVALGAIPVYADVLTIPKLSYNPTIGQLMTDYSLQQQMLKLDGIYGKEGAEFGIGVDDTNTNFILDYTTDNQDQTLVIQSNIVVDKTHAAGAKPNKDAFYVAYLASFEPEIKEAAIALGNDNGTWNPQQKQLPVGFKWDAAYTKTYFEPNQNHGMIATQIPNSYMGPGGSNGLYGMYVVLARANATHGPSYPGPGHVDIPSSYASYRTAIPIDMFPKWAVIPTAFTTILATLFTARKNRMDKIRKRGTGYC